MRPVHPDRRLVGMARIIHVGSQSQSRWDERFFEYAHFRSWESGVEDEILRRNPNAWIQHRANVGSSPNDLTTCRPQDVDALAYEWGKEQGRMWLAVRSDGRSVHDRSRHAVLANEVNIEGVFSPWGYRGGGLWTDDEHQAIAFMFAHSRVFAALGFNEVVLSAMDWIDALSPNGYIADGLGPHGSWRPELSIWHAFGQPDLRRKIEELNAGPVKRLGTALHTYGEPIRPGNPAYLDTAVRLLCPPELQREGGAYGGSRIEHALQAMSQYGLLELLPVMVGEWNRQVVQVAGPEAIVQVPPDWPSYVALVKRYAPSCPFTSTQTTFSDRELARWEYEALVRRTIGQFPEADWGPWLLFGHLFEDERFGVLQMANVPPVLELKRVVVEVEEEETPMPTFIGAMAVLAGKLRAAGYVVEALKNETAIGGGLIRQVATINGEPRVLEYQDGAGDAWVVARSPIVPKG